MTLPTRIGLVGDHQAQALARLMSLSTHRQVRYLGPSHALPGSWEATLKDYDLVCLQTGDPLFTPEPDLPGAENLIRFPFLYNPLFWPFCFDAIVNRGVATAAGMRGPLTDIFIARLRANHLDPDEAAEQYLDADIASLCLTKAVKAKYLEQLGRLDDATGLRMRQVIEDDLQEEQLFHNPVRPGPRLTAALASQLVALAGGSDGEIAAALTLRPTPDRPYVPLPVTPQISEVLELRFLAPCDISDVCGAAEEMRAYVVQAMTSSRPQDGHDPGLGFAGAGGSGARAGRCGQLPSSPAQPAPLDARGQFEQARHALQSGDQQAATAAAWRCQMLDPFSPECRNMLAEVLEAGGERKQAVDILEAGLRVDCSDAQTFSLLGNFYIRDGDAARAEQAFLIGVNLDPDREDLRSCLADARAVRWRQAESPAPAVSRRAAAPVT